MKEKDLKIAFAKAEFNRTMSALVAEADQCFCEFRRKIDLKRARNLNDATK